MPVHEQLQGCLDIYIYMLHYIFLQRSTFHWFLSWWLHQMATLSVLLAFCEGNPLATNGFPSHRQVTWSFDVFFDLPLNGWAKQSRHQWFETRSCSLWCHCNGCWWVCFSHTDDASSKCYSSRTSRRNAINNSLGLYFSSLGHCEILGKHH